jgi:hypothetical protein
MRDTSEDKVDSVGLAQPSKSWWLSAKLLSDRPDESTGGEIADGSRFVAMRVQFVSRPNMRSMPFRRRYAARLAGARAFSIGTAMGTSAMRRGQREGDDPATTVGQTIGSRFRCRSCGPNIIRWRVDGPASRVAQ